MKKLMKRIFLSLFISYKALAAINPPPLPSGASTEATLLTIAGLLGGISTPAYGTVGQVQYNNGSGVLGANANFFWDITNNRLGVGTSVPLAQVHVLSVASTSIGQIIQGATSQTADLFQAQNSSSTALVRIRSDGKIVGDGSLLTGIAAGASASLYGHVHSASAGSCIWTATPTNSTPIAFGVQSSCNAATASGNASAPSSKIPAIRFASGIADGGYLFQWHGNFTSNGSGHWCTWFMNDGSANKYIGAQMVNAAQYGLPMLEILYVSSGLASTDTTFQLEVASALTQCDGVIQMNVAPIDFDVDVIKLW